MTSKEIGGYFNLELQKHPEYHPNALHLNSGRAALQYILKAKKYKKIYLPSYICNSVLTPICAENIHYEYYPITATFEPIFNKDIQDDEAFLYVNYFGLHNDVVKNVTEKFSNVIIDNTQAFYALPKSNVDTFYSARKFFGVSDGAYLYTDQALNDSIEKDISYNRMEHLLKRIDLAANDGYSAFRQSEEILNNSGMKGMSNLTRRILCSIDYKKCAEQRVENYQYLHEHLGEINKLQLKDLGEQVPMVYPFYCEEEGLRDYLIKNKIYVATYWNEVLERVKHDSQEALFTKHLLALPIDQRYTSDDMKCIIQHIQEKTSHV